jgi:hypothetical protein
MPPRVRVDPLGVWDFENSGGLGCSIIDKSKGSKAEPRGKVSGSFGSSGFWDSWRIGA